MTPPTLGVILAGGLARRMGGGDKTLLRLGGRTLLDHVTERLGPQCASGLVLNANGDPSRFSEFPGAIVPDGIAGHPGPLAGILAGLDYAAEHHPNLSHIVSVAGDTPFLPPDLVARFYATQAEGDAPIVVATSGGRDHYIVALWPVALRDALHAALVTGGDHRVAHLVARHGYLRATWPAEPVDPFLNVNEPADLAAAENHHGLYEPAKP